jgi:D-glycero-alpha-D-manno-heptose 1-phosphate guanylyltransferase
MRENVISLAVILAGGLGTRIRHLLPDLPKPLAPVAGRPFLEWVVRFLYAQGVTRILISTGYLGDRIGDFAKTMILPGLELSCVREPAPLGTAGAVIHSLESLPKGTMNVLVCNGDSLALADLRALLTALTQSGTDASLLAVRVPDAAHYGTVRADDDGMLQGFYEKRPGAGLANAGVYMLHAATVARFPDTVPLSFEYDVFPSLLEQGLKLKVVPCDCPFLDIGRESTLAKAETFVRANMEWFHT